MVLMNTQVIGAQNLGTHTSNTLFISNINSTMQHVPLNTGVSRERRIESGRVMTRIKTVDGHCGRGRPVHAKSK